jgi:DNA-directed RNA polymerase specialized sigma24 family protein
VTLEEVEAQAVPQNIEESADRSKALDRLLSLVHRLELPDRQLMMAYLEGLDAESISEITGHSMANVWTRIHRIKSVLVRQFHSGGTNAK